MTFLFYLVIVGFTLGNVASLSSGTGMRVSLLDIFVSIFVCSFLLFSSFRRQALGSYVRLFMPFILIAWVSLLVSLTRFSLSDIGMASLYLLRFIIYSLLTVVVAYSPGVKKFSIVGLWIGGVMMAIFGLFQYFLYPNLRNLSYLGWDPHEFRVFSTLLDPNFTGIILVLTLILSRYIYLKKYFENKIVIISSGLTFLTLLLTYSRGSYIAFILSLLVVGIHLKNWKQIILITIVFFSAVFVLPKPGGEGVDLTRTISIYSRFEDNKEAWKIFTKSPILGVGFDTLRYARGENQLTVGTQDVSHSGAGFHNSWLFILTTTGIVGLLAYVWIWEEVFHFFSGTEPLLKELLMISTTAVFVHSFFDNSLFYPFVMVWMWVLAGNLVKENISLSVRSS